MTRMGKTVLGALLGAGALAFSSIGASAAIVCSANVCWHVHDTYDYPPTAHVIVHPDTWRWGPSEHFTFREHEGRGYWRGDNWVEW